MRLAIREDGAAFAEAERRGGGRDGLKVGLGRAPVMAAVDLGASKVACFILKPDGVRPADRSITACGVGYVQSRGIRGGAVIEVEEAASAIAKASGARRGARQGQRRRGYRLHVGRPLASRRLTANVSLGRPGRSGTRTISRAIGAAVSGLKMPGRRIIHVRPIGWSVDGAKGVRDPRSMYGRQLGLHLLLVSIDEQVFQTIAHCVERAHLQFDGVVAAPFASALATLEEDEMDLGAILIDMGRRLDLAGGLFRRQPDPRRQPGRRRLARHPGRGPRPFHLDHRRRADQDPARSAIASSNEDPR